MATIRFTRYIILTLISVLAFQPAAFATHTDFTVVIDAGHGGKDAGAMDNGLREKNINLGVALKLAQMLKKKNKNIKVVLTRDKDVFLTLQERAEVANKAHADLFISIHTNSLDLKNPNRKTIEGASTYTLGLQKDKNNMDVARRENSVIAYEADYNTKYSGFDPNSDESYIIFEMAQKANMSQSVKFAEAVQRQMVKTASRKDRGVKQAGFWVLWATSMPSVLVELDFITNPDVAEFLGSEKGQTKLATAIYNATDGYFKALETERKNGKLVGKGKSDLTGDNNSGAASSGEGVVLASASESSHRTTTTAASRNNTASSSQRRRRGDKAREKSENREYEVAVIKQEREYVVQTPASQEESVTEATQSPKPAKENGSKNRKKESKKKKNKKSSGKQERIVNGRKVVIGEQASAESTAKPVKKEAVKKKDKSRTTRKSDSKRTNGKRAESTAPVKLEKKEVVYRIQILASEDRLKTNNPRFCGLSPISCTKCDKIYKYTYGETTDREEIYKMLNMVRKKIPDAFVVSAPR